MHPSLRMCSARAHHPLIQFIGKRSWPATPEAPHAHQAAPPELKEKFSQFLQKIESSAPSSTPSHSQGSKKGVFHEFWEAPERFWRPRVRDLEDAEIEAITSGGATLR